MDFSRTEVCCHPPALCSAWLRNAKRWARGEEDEESPIRSADLETLISLFSFPPTSTATLSESVILSVGPDSAHQYTIWQVSSFFISASKGFLLSLNTLYELQSRNASIRRHHFCSKINKLNLIQLEIQNISYYLFHLYGSHILGLPNHIFGEQSWGNQIFCNCPNCVYEEGPCSSSSSIPSGP